MCSKSFISTWILDPDATPERLNELLSLLLKKEVTILQTIPANNSRPAWVIPDISVTSAVFLAVYEKLTSTSHSLTEIARETNTSVSIVRNIIDHIELGPPSSLPETLGIDEFLGSSGFYDPVRKRYLTEKYHCGRFEPLPDDEAFFRLIYKMATEILSLEEEVVRWRQLLIKYLDKRWADGPSQDIFSNLAPRFSGIPIYDRFIDEYCNGKDPMESREHTRRMFRLRDGIDETSIHYL